MLRTYKFINRMYNHRTAKNKNSVATIISNYPVFKEIQEEQFLQEYKKEDKIAESCLRNC